MKLSRILSVTAIAMVALTGCHKHHDPYPEPTPDPTPTPTPTPEQTFKLDKRSDWSVLYIGREDYTEADGSVSRVENIEFKYTGDAYFIFRTISPQDMADLYAGSLEDFFKAEAAAVVSAAGDGNFYDDVYNVFTASTKTVLFDLIIHGTYSGYLIEMSSDGNATGSYAVADFTVEEERAVDDYLQWIGTWHVADSYCGYDIEISACENNYFYYIDGWETGPAVTEQMTMDRDWIYARYRNATGMLYFYGQYLMTYDETFSDGTTTTVDEMFVGTYLTSTSDSNGEVDGEGADYGYDIAHTAVAADGTVTVEPESFDFDNGYHATYHSMRYSRFCYDEENWAHYNTSGVPSLPLTMTAIPATKSTVHAPALRKATKATVHRNQPRGHQDRPARTSGCTRFR